MFIPWHGTHRYAHNEHYKYVCPESTNIYIKPVLQYFCSGLLFESDKPCTSSNTIDDVIAGTQTYTAWL